MIVLAQVVILSRQELILIYISLHSGQRNNPNLGFFPASEPVGQSLRLSFRTRGDADAVHRLASHFNGRQYRWSMVPRGQSRSQSFCEGTVLVRADLHGKGRLIGGGSGGEGRPSLSSYGRRRRPLRWELTPLAACRRLFSLCRFNQAAVNLGARDCRPALDLTQAMLSLLARRGQNCCRFALLPQKISRTGNDAQIVHFRRQAPLVHGDDPHGRLVQTMVGREEDAFCLCECWFKRLPKRL